MKEKTKEFLKKNLIGFILGFVSVGVIAVYAETYFPSNNVTYDNKESGLTSTNVQGAIDELYKTCIVKKVDIGGIEVSVVEEGDGLYEDEYEDERYFYKGENPNNYVTFNNEKAGWRIVSIEPDKTIKLMKTASVAHDYWDSSKSNNWARPTSLNTYLNVTYYNNKLNATAKKQIVAKDWGIGAVSYNDNNMANTINNENGTKWNGKVALVTVSEYVRSNSNKRSCGTVQQLWNVTGEQCKETTWMYYSDNYWWTLSPCSAYSNYVFAVSHSNGSITSGGAGATNAIRPSVYLSPNIKITGGTGTSSDPYQISL